MSVKKQIKENWKTRRCINHDESSRKKGRQMFVSRIQISLPKVVTKVKQKFWSSKPRNLCHRNDLRRHVSSWEKIQETFKQRKIPVHFSKIKFKLKLNENLMQIRCGTWCLKFIHEYFTLKYRKCWKSHHEIMNLLSKYLCWRASVENETILSGLSKFWEFRVQNCDVRRRVRECKDNINR